ncbi:fatty acyl-CoA reductase wat-like isoform X2 [Zootermopsis nevadensis]|nr:fatty acyl-CoA reductase wat-like isoform X2 [Zootermopsis nevadensis]
METIECNGTNTVAVENLSGSFISKAATTTNNSAPSFSNRKVEHKSKIISDLVVSSQLTSEERVSASNAEISSIRSAKQMHLSEDRGTTVQEFYRGANVLITGGTGFMGKVLVEKLLRSCPHLSSIYLLVRSKKGKDVGLRMQEIFEDPLFEKLREVQPGFREKILPVEGDCSKPGLDLSPCDRQRIVDNVHIVFHMAATVRFDEKLQIATAINVVGTRELLLLCRDCPNIKVVVHVSTAFSHCHRTSIDEEFYDPPTTGERIVQLVEKLDDNTLTTITPKILGAWPNTYTYTKAIAEDIVRTVGKDLPVGVFRPSIILCTRSEPVPGWIDNLYGPTGAVACVGLGMIRTMHFKGKMVGDMVPCDMAVNALVTSAWHIHEQRRSGTGAIPVYNYVSSCENPISWGDYINKNIKYSWQVPFDNAVWMVTLTEVHVHSLYKLYALLIHLLPALIGDIALLILRQKPRFMKTYKKLHKFTDVISYFCTRQWKFSNQNVHHMWNKLSEDDRKIFDFNISNLNWDLYLRQGLMGLRTFVLKEDPKNLPQTIRKRYRLYWLHQCVKFFFFFIFLWLCWSAIISIF